MQTDTDEDFPPGFRAQICRIAMRPIIGILLRCGMSFAEFSKTTRSVYVEVAANEFGLRGQRANKSRIAMLTGLSRPRVKAELEALDAPDSVVEDKDKIRPASRVLLGWYTDSHFADAPGQPRELTGEQFGELFERYSGKVVPMTAMLKELLNVGAVEMTDDGKLRVLTRSFTPQRADASGIRRVCTAIADLAATASFNLFSGKTQNRRFERFATNQLIAASDARDFGEFLEAEGQAFLERIDNWMTRREIQKGEGEDLIRIGVGVYQIAPNEKKLKR